LHGKHTHFNFLNLPSN